MEGNNIKNYCKQLLEMNIRYENPKKSLFLSVSLKHLICSTKSPLSQKSCAFFLKWGFEAFCTF